MWILNYVTKNSISEQPAEKGSVKLSSGGRLQVSASSEYSSIPAVAPYGIVSLPPVGAETVVISAGRENIYLGAISPSEELSPGELMLRSEGGATIALKNDGYVYINGRRVE